jgi:polyhydroxyalkanoate synthesis regulator phasin
MKEITTVGELTNKELSDLMRDVVNCLKAMDATDKAAHSATREVFEAVQRLDALNDERVKRLEEAIGSLGDQIVSLDYRINWLKGVVHISGLKTPPDHTKGEGK